MSEKSPWPRSKQAKCRTWHPGREWPTKKQQQMLTRREAWRQNYHLPNPDIRGPGPGGDGPPPSPGLAVGVGPTGMECYGSGGSL